MKRGGFVSMSGKTWRDLVEEARESERSMCIADTCQMCSGEWEGWGRPRPPTKYPDGRECSTWHHRREGDRYPVTMPCRAYKIHQRAAEAEGSDPAAYVELDENT